jgi:hypothetical protein
MAMTNLSGNVEDMANSGKWLMGHCHEVGGSWRDPAKQMSLQEDAGDNDPAPIGS